MSADRRALYWDSQRRSLYELLAQVDPDLAGLYRQIIVHMDHSAEPGEEKARLTVVAHSVRELINNLPDALGDVPDLPAAPGENESRVRTELERVFEGSAGSSLDPAPEASKPTDTTDVVTIPRALLDTVGRAVAVFRAARVREELRDSAAVLGRRDQLDPALKPWKGARNFFMRYAHLNRFKVRQLPTDEQVMTQIEIIEASLRVRLGAFFDNLTEINGIVDRANAGGPDDFAVPSDEEVLSTLARLGSLQLRRAFYGRLENPIWVAALAKSGAFRNPPSMRLEEDRTYRVDPWPEIDFLVRMAPLAGRDVAAVLAAIPNTDNQWVRRGTFEAAASLCPADAVKLVPKLVGWPQEEVANFRVDPDDIKRLIVHLLEGGEHSKGQRLADAFFTPQPPAQQPQVGTPEPVAGIGDYEYAQALPEVSRALGSSRLKTLQRWLKAYQTHSESFAGESGFDTSYIWRPSIRGEEASHAHEIGHSLIDALRAGLSEAIQQCANPARRLLQDDQPLFRRIALDVLATAIETKSTGPDRNSRTLGQYEMSLIAIAQDILADETFLESSYRAEFMPFVRACLAWEGAIDVGPFFDHIRQGPLALRDQRQGRFAQADDTPEEAKARRQSYAKHWQHTLLTLVGPDQLPSDLKQLLTSLDEEYGALRVQDSSFHMESFSGPTSPLSLESMRALIDDDLLEHLGSWRSQPDVFGTPSHEGQGRVLTELIAQDPTRMADRLDDIKRLRPTYVRAVVQGWRTAVEAGRTVDWNLILPLCEWAVDLDESVPVESEGRDFDDDSGFRPLRFEVLRLLSSGLSAKSAERPCVIEEGDSARVLDMLCRYADDPDPTAEYEAEYGGDNMDPLTLSLNTVRPVAMSALVRLVHRFPAGEVAERALGILDQHIGRGDSSLAVAAVFGEGTGRLYDSARSWIEERVETVFGDSFPTTAWQQVALSSALAIHRPHAALIELLRRPLLLTIDQLSTTELATGWRSGMRSFPQLVGDWITWAIVTGNMEMGDALVTSWFRAASPELRGDVLGHSAWQFMREESIPQDVLERAARLWDQRVDHVKQYPQDVLELAGSYWLARSDKFGDSWWLSILAYASSVIPGFSMHGMVGERLAAASEKEPEMVLQILENVMPSSTDHQDRMQYDLMDRAVPKAIAVALDSSNKKLRVRANALMNKLGEMGYIDLQDRMNQLRKRPEDGLEPRPN